MKTRLTAIGICLILSLTACTGADIQTASDIQSAGSVQSTGSVKASDNPDEESDKMKNNYDFTAFNNVEITGTDLNILSNEEKSVLYQQAKYCQAMTDAGIETLSSIIADDMIFTHMSGKKQTKDEYLGDIENGSLDYHKIGIENPIIKVSENTANITFTSVLNANAYGAQGTFRMKGTHHYEKRGNDWIAVNG